MGNAGIFGDSIWNGAVSGFGDLDIDFAVNNPVPTSRLMPSATRIPVPRLPAPPRGPCPPAVYALGPNGYPMAAPSATPSTQSGVVVPVGPSGTTLVPQSPSGTPRPQVMPLGPGARRSPQMIGVGTAGRRPTMTVPVKPARPVVPIVQGRAASPTRVITVGKAHGVIPSINGFNGNEIGGGIFDAAALPTNIGDPVPWRRPNAGGVVRVPAGCQPPQAPRVVGAPTVTLPPMSARSCPTLAPQCAEQTGGPTVVVPAPSGGCSGFAGPHGGGHHGHRGGGGWFRGRGGWRTPVVAAIGPQQWEFCPPGFVWDPGSDTCLPGFRPYSY